MKATRARRHLLLRRRDVCVERLCGDRDRPEVLGEELCVKALPGARPEERRELEHAVLGPQRYEADEGAQVVLGVEVVQARGGDEGVERAGALSVVVAAAKQLDHVWSGSYAYSIEGAVSTWNTTCPEPDSYDQGLSVDGNMLTLSIDMTGSGCGIALWSYERQ